MTSQIWTIGHWNRSEGQFARLLKLWEIELVIDVRSFPGSRRSPWFGKEEMQRWLPEHKIGYSHSPLLGGRRRKLSQGDLNAGWENTSFRNYADYTLTEDFECGLEDLELAARIARVAICCGEPHPTRCHRSLIASVLVARGWEVAHIIESGIIMHELGKWGAQPVVCGGRVTYPAISEVAA